MTGIGLMTINNIGHSVQALWSEVLQDASLLVSRLIYRSGLTRQMYCPNLRPFCTLAISGYLA
ncbi:hypothetical protein BGX38DRAFT_1208496 [Terfezia claveryi]|nr:hypothetical protein BGX38DRAFT_1208496 [Terfezia claveryi]